MALELFATRLYEALEERIPGTVMPNYKFVGNDEVSRDEGIYEPTRNFLTSITNPDWKFDSTVEDGNADAPGIGCSVDQFYDGKTAPREFVDGADFVEHIGIVGSNGMTVTLYRKAQSDHLELYLDETVDGLFDRYEQGAVAEPVAKLTWEEAITEIVRYFAKESAN